MRVSVRVNELVLGRAADFDAILVQDLDGCFILTADALLLSHVDTGTNVGTISCYYLVRTKRKERTKEKIQHINISNV